MHLPLQPEDSIPAIFSCLVIILSHVRSNISNPAMRTGLDFKPRTGSKCEDLKSSPVRIGGFEMTSHTNKSLLKVR